MNDWFEDSDIALVDKAITTEEKIVYDENNMVDEDLDVPYASLEDAVSEANAATTQPIEVPSYDSLASHEKEFWETIDKFEERAWSDQVKGIATGWTELDKAFDGGLQTGWVIIGGDSNIGKSGWISQLAWQIAENNDNVYVIDISLDDPMHDKLPRVVGSMNRVIINAVRNPQNYSQFPKMIERRTQGIAKLRNMVDKYRAFSTSETSNISDIDVIEDIVRKHMVYLDEKGEKKRIVLLIDNFHDLTTSSPEARGGDKEKYDYLAQRCSDMATKYDIVVITTAEFKKLNGFRRPQVDDIRESVKIKYEAKAILLCYNEVSLKGEAASVYFERQGEAAKQPVFEVKFDKNKFSSFKGRLFYEFYPEMALFEPADDTSSKQYNNLIYANN